MIAIMWVVGEQFGKISGDVKATCDAFHLLLRISISRSLKFPPPPPPLEHIHDIHEYFQYRERGGW